MVNSSNWLIGVCEGIGNVSVSFIGDAGSPGVDVTGALPSETDPSCPSLVFFSISSTETVPG